MSRAASQAELRRKITAQQDRATSALKKQERSAVVIVGLDFDGTLFEHVPYDEFPAIGKDIGAFSWLRQYQRTYKHLRYVLWTVRSSEPLEYAVRAIAFEDVFLWGVNENPQQKEWSDSPKAHLHCLVDDISLGTPLVESWDGDRPYVDWRVMGPMLDERIIQLHREKGVEV